MATDSGPPEDGVVTLDDPRVAVLLPATIRPALIAVAELDRQLALGLAAQREPMLGQIRIAWWREALARGDGAAAPADPALHALVDSGAATAVLPLLDAWEGIVVATDADTRSRAAAARGEALFAIADRLMQGPGCARGAGAGWGQVSLALWWGDMALLPADARPRGGVRGRALIALDRWANVVAAARGARHPLKEGWSLMTAAFARA